jgi:hypothetical protein
MSDDIGKSVRERLYATSEVTAICKSQIYADVLEQNAQPPAVVVFVESNLAHEDLSGTNRCFQAQIQVFAYGKDRDQANLLAKAIRDSALPANLQGIYNGMDYKDVSLTFGPSEMVDQPVAGGWEWRKITKQTFTIWANAT